MKYGLYAAANGALTSMYRQDVLANNLANLHTVGFKPDVAALQQALPEREASLSLAEPRDVLERLGGVVHAMPTRVAFAQGDLVASNRELDVAVAGEGLMAVRADDGPAGIRLTRDGRFTLGDNGTIVSVSSGLPLLDDANQPIRVDPDRPVHIDSDGVVRQDQAPVARLQLVPHPPGDRVEKAGDGLLRMKPGEPLPTGRGTGQIRQGYTESSAIDAISVMNKLMAAAKAANGNLKLMQYHDQLTAQAINVLARV